MGSTPYKILIIRTQSTLIMPKLVLDELEAVYKRELKMRLQALSRASGSVDAMLVKVDYERPKLTIEEETDLYLKYLRKKLHLTDRLIVDFHDSYLRDVMDRAIQRARPCSSKGEEIRDAVLWNTVLDIASGTSDKMVIFISNNTRQFAGQNNSLHADLVSETEKRGVKIHYYTSLDDFVKHHTVKIDFITIDWLNEQIDHDEIYERAWEEAAGCARRRLQDQLGTNQSATGGINTSGGGFDVGEYFVYEMTDGSLQVACILFGNIHFSFEVEETIDRSGWNYEHKLNPRTGDLDIEPVYHWETEKELGEQDIEVDLTVVVNLVIKKRKVLDWDLVDVNER